jgi:hypothetical protein
MYIYSGANLTAQIPITKLAQVRRKNNKHKLQSKAVYIIIEKQVKLSP